MILESKNGKIRMENYHLALEGSSGRDLFQIKYRRILQYTEADRSFAWFLYAKLMEAEGVHNIPLANAYLEASMSLELRMMAEGHAGRRLVNHERWFENYKMWRKAAIDITKIRGRPEGLLSFGKSPWIVERVCIDFDYHFARILTIDLVQSQNDCVVRTGRLRCQSAYVWF